MPSSLRGAWTLYATLTAALFCVVALLCWLAIPDFASIAPFQMHAPKAETSASDITIDYHLRLRQPDAQLLYVPAYGGDLSLSINRGTSQPVTAIDDVQLTRSRHVAIMSLAARMFRVGDNQITVRQSGNFHGVPLAPAYLGPTAPLSRVAEQQRGWGWLMQQLIPIAGLLTVLLSTLLIFFSRQPLKYFFLILAFALQTVLELDDQIWIAGHSARELGPHLGVAVNFCIAMAVVHWTGAAPHRRRFVRLMGGVMMTIAVAISLSGLSENPAVYLLTLILYGFYVVALHIGNWLMILESSKTRNMGQILTLVIFTLSITGIFAYVALFYRGYPIALTFFLSNWVNIATTVAVSGFIVGALINELLSYRADRNQLGVLGAIAAGHHADADAQAQALRREIEQRAILEERQRFVRDMHDGIGGQLLSVLMKLRRGDAPSREIAQEVQSTIAELRLITAAMDSQTPGIEGALIDLQGRLRAQLEPASVELVWRMPRNLRQNMMSSRDVIELLRIVQETVTNAARHAQAKGVTVDIADDATDAALRITITDDGCGFDMDKAPPGQGIRNMRRRAEKIGGSLEIVSQPGGGTRVVLSVPHPA